MASIAGRSLLRRRFSSTRKKILRRWPRLISPARERIPSMWSCSTTTGGMILRGSHGAARGLSHGLTAIGLSPAGIHPGTDGAVPGMTPGTRGSTTPGSMTPGSMTPGTHGTITTPGITITGRTTSRPALDSRPTAAIIMVPGAIPRASGPQSPVPERREAATIREPTPRPAATTAPPAPPPSGAARPTTA